MPFVHPQFTRHKDDVDWITDGGRICGSRKHDDRTLSGLLLKLSRQIDKVLIYLFTHEFQNVVRDGHASTRCHEVYLSRYTLGWPERNVFSGFFHASHA